MLDIIPASENPARRLSMPLYSSLPKADAAAIDTASAERRSIDDLDREICALGIELAGQPSLGARPPLLVPTRYPPTAILEAE
jgi:hypothetical protein